jgi:hypothetical protein
MTGFFALRMIERQEGGDSDIRIDYLCIMRKRKNAKVMKCV